MQQVFEQVDAAIAAWEQRIAAGEAIDVDAALACAIEQARTLIDALHPAARGAPDLLEAFKFLVRGDPSWNAVRDNLRELVYYRNCLDAGRADALPAVPGRMAIRTSRHVYLYMRTRWQRDQKG